MIYVKHREMEIIKNGKYLIIVCIMELKNCHYAKK